MDLDFKSAYITFNGQLPIIHPRSVRFDNNRNVHRSPVLLNYLNRRSKMYEHSVMHLRLGIMGTAYEEMTASEMAGGSCYRELSCNDTISDWGS